MPGQWLVSDKWFIFQNWRWPRPVVFRQYSIILWSVFQSWSSIGSIFCYFHDFRCVPKFKTSVRIDYFFFICIDAPNYLHRLLCSRVVCPTQHLIGSVANLVSWFLVDTEYIVHIQYIALYIVYVRWGWVRHTFSVFDTLFESDCLKTF